MAPAPWAAVAAKSLDSAPKDLSKARIDWADLKDDEEELMALKAEHATMLEAKDRRIDELEHDNRERNCRIGELDLELQKKESRISALEHMVEKLKDQIAEKELEYANLANSKRSAESDNKNSDNATEDAKLEEKIEISVPTTTLNVAEPKHLDVSPTTTKATSLDSDECRTQSSNTSVEKDSIPKKASTSADGPTASSTAIEGISALSATSPKSKLAHNSVPKPAPVLKFPGENKIQSHLKSLPMMAPTKPAFIPQPAVSKNGWTGSSKNLDIRDMTLGQRVELFRGPSVAIYIGQHPLRGAPKHMLMQASKSANAYFTEYPQAESVHFPINSMAFPAVKHIVDWLIDMGSCKKVYSIPLLPDKFLENLSIRRAARVLGMDRYVNHFTKNYCDYIRAQMPTLDELAIIEKFCAQNDPLFECLVNNLAHKQIKGEIPNTEGFEKFLEKHGKLAVEIKDSCAKILKSRRNRVEGSKQASRAESDSGSIASARGEWNNEAANKRIGKYTGKKNLKTTPLKQQTDASKPQTNDSKPLHLISVEDPGKLPRRGG
ncbi:hypothetical protein EJ04DRAFT_588402 [Polyplosphaeria fusca]|uniref:Uncharacterized protein n=1 Tax=Polyplosphaeria fusca TaxID=682080 RepID=A0A9P4QNI6_9PLEO|nr:hypothetical protein EJ04DRAFT_588402 [Polyplosphaeria fusca]